MDVHCLEAAYLARASAGLASRVRQLEVVLPDRSLVDGDPRTMLAGWWVSEEDARGRVVLPNPYDSVEAIAAMERQVWEVAERLGPELGQSIEAITGRSPRGDAYWHTLLSPWLVHLLSAIADRRLFLRAVSAVAPEVPLAVPEIPVPPAHAAEAVHRLRTDPGNAGLLALLATGVGTRTTEQPMPRQVERGRARRPRRGAGDLARALPYAAVVAMLARLPGRELGLVGLTRLSTRDLIRLETRAHGIAALPRPILRRSGHEYPPADAGARSRLSLPEPVDPLESLALQAMPHLLPRSLLEGLELVEAQSRRRYGGPLHALVGNYSFDEVQNEFLGRCRAAGKRLAFAQHGGMYGQAPVNAQERLETADGSVFLSWGASGPNVIPTPNPYLERIRDTHRGGARITLVEALEPPDAYVLRFAGHPLANQGYETSRMLSELVERLPSDRRSQLVLKRFPNLATSPSRAAALEALPSDGPSGGATSWMAVSRMVVVPYPDTPFIEAMVLGTPTIGLWNPAHWPLRSELQPMFERLGEAQIVHSDPASAAAHIDSVYDETDTWWRAPEVVGARAEFLRRFAVAGDWLESWTARLRDLSR